MVVVNFPSCQGLRTVYAADRKFRAESIMYGCTLYAHQSSWKYFVLLSWKLLYSCML